VPRVVPSQVVALIDQMFPWAVNQPDDAAHRVFLDIGHAPALEAVVRLAEQIPSELLPADFALYGQFEASIAAIRTSFSIWMARGGINALVSLAGFGHLSPVTLIRRALIAAPDEAPAPATVELAFISDPALRGSIRSDISAANQDLAQGEWKGATVLAGSAVEALLLWKLQEYEQQHPGTRQTAVTTLRGNNTLNQNPPANIDEWNLHQFTEVSSHLGVIQQETAIQARQAKNFRNLIHPGRATRLGQTCDRGTALAALAAVYLVVRDLTPP
jgi:hypothetical protein